MDKFQFATLMSGIFAVGAVIANSGWLLVAALLWTILSFVHMFASR